MYTVSKTRRGVSKKEKRRVHEEVSYVKNYFKIFSLISAVLFTLLIT